MKNKKTSGKIPQVVVLVNILASYLDSGMDEGEDIAMTPLANEIKKIKGSGHRDTIRDKLTEGFVLRDILNLFEPTFREGQLIRIRKLKQNEMKMKGILSYLIELKSDQEKIRKDIKAIKINLNKK